MSGCVNRATLIGFLGADPEMKYIPSGAGVCEFRIATTETWTKDGQKQESTTWHRIIAWSKLAEICAKFLHKGSMVYVEGRIQTRTYDDKDGVKKYVTEIVASEVKFLDRKGDGKRDEGGPPPPSSGGGTGYGGGLDEDIPF